MVTCLKAGMFIMFTVDIGITGFKFFLCPSICLPSWVWASLSTLQRQSTSCNSFICKLFFFWCCLVTKSCPTLLWPHGLQPTRLPCPWDFSGKNTGVGCPILLQGIFLTHGSNLHLLHWQAASLPLSHQGSFFCFALIPY